MYAIRSYYEGGEVETLLLARVVDACVAAGARPALPGEFTRRAVAAGRLDLVHRITSYNICYTKLLRRPRVRPESLWRAAATRG